jgi:hypothetical protein
MLHKAAGSDIDAFELYEKPYDIEASVNESRMVAISQFCWV